MTKPLHIPPGHSLFTVSITTTWELEEEFVVAAPSKEEAWAAAKQNSDPDIFDADEVETCGHAAPVDLAALNQKRIASIARTADLGIIHRDPGSHLDWDCDPNALLETFMDPGLLAAAILAEKERNNGQLALPEGAG